MVALAAVCLVVAALAALPLLRNRIFYFWDDSAAAFLPGWRVIGEGLLSGDRRVLDPDLWMGGNLAAEAQLGLWNPVSLLNYLLVALLPDLAVAAAMVKMEFLVILAAGTFLLAREYGVRRPIAVAVAVAVPFAGFTLWFEASSWAAGLMAFAWVPHVWWSARRMTRGRLPPVVPFTLGFLAMTTGSPYGALGVVVVLGALGLESLLSRRHRGVVHLVVTGLCIGASALVVFLPLLLSSDVTWRQNQRIANDGFLVPGLGDVLNLSSPAFLPHFTNFSGSSFSVPITYLAWFVVPLVPWVRWRSLAQRARDITGLFVVGGTYLVLALGPSNMWMFRWPARLVEYLYLPVMILVGLLLSAGLRADRSGLRSSLTVALVVLGGYLAWAADPDRLRRQLVTGVLVLALTAAAVAASRRSLSALAAVLVAGTAATLTIQLTFFPANYNVASWNFPHAVQQLEGLGTRYSGTTFLVADQSLLQDEMSPDQAWQDLLLGSMWAVGEVESVNSYTGLGFTKLTDTICLNYVGASCRAAYGRLWEPAGPDTPVPLADALRVDTVVVQKELFPGGLDPVPDGWSLDATDDRVLVLTRDSSIVLPGRLGWTSTGVTAIVGTTSSDTVERLQVSTSPEGGTVTFARLAWPGYVATIDGRDVATRVGDAGLLTIDLPPGLDAAVLDVSFTPPGWRAGALALLAAVMVSVIHSVADARDRRRSRLPVVPSPLARS
jgi:hypothetical protein